MHLSAGMRVPARIGAAALLLGAAVFVAATLPGRAAVEARPPAVEICVDFLSANTLALRAEVPVDTVLAACGEDGVTSAALSEETIGQYTPDPSFMRRRYGLAGGVAPAGRFVPEWWDDDLPAGFAPEKRTAIASAGLDVVLRPTNAGDPAWVAREVRTAGQKFLLDGREVPGYPAPAALFEQLPGALFVVPEFITPAGGVELKQSFPRRVIQAHALYPAEQVKIPSLEMRDARWARAVRERGVRFLLVYLDERHTVDDNRTYVRSIASAVRAEGFTVGVTAPPAYPFGGNNRLRLLIVMMVAVLFPCVSIIVARRYASPVIRFIAANAVTLLGGLTIAALLFDGVFMQRIAAVPGIKAAMLLPLMLAPLALFPRAQLRRLWQQPIAVRHAIIAALVAAMIAIVLVRSGNTSLDWARPDMGMRHWLEDLLSIRPRTKEFLFGQPLLMAGFLLGSPWLVWLGMVGQVSLINTFLHAHTPVVVSLIRTLYGIVLGGCIGWAAGYIVKKVRPARLS